MNGIFHFSIFNLHFSMKQSIRGSNDKKGKQRNENDKFEF